MKPLYMWAGGKNKVIKHYLPYLPSDFTDYYEPFMGGGAMFIYVMTNYQPKNVYINDINSDVMNIYQSIKNDYDIFLKRLIELESKYISLQKDDRKKLYYEIRQEHAYDYEKWSKSEEASTLYFLMKTGFNGIYQLNHNTNGRYGTPSGLLNQKTEIFDRKVLSWWKKALENVTITSTDWKNAVKDNPDAFYFFDPPYRDSFADYGNPFTEEMLIDLIDFSDRQSKVFVANRADDDWFETRSKSLNLHYFDITYTAGRRKNGKEAKKAREILLYHTDRVDLLSF